MTGAFEDLKQPDKSEFDCCKSDTELYPRGVTNIDQPCTHCPRRLAAKSEFVSHTTRQEYSLTYNSCRKIMGLAAAVVSIQVR